MVNLLWWERGKEVDGLERQKYWWRARWGRS